MFLMAQMEGSITNLHLQEASSFFRSLDNTAHTFSRNVDQADFD